MVRISHQTIINYAPGLLVPVKIMVNYYPYKIGSLLADDEPHIKVRGKISMYSFDQILILISLHHILFIQHVIPNVPVSQSMTV